MLRSFAEAWQSRIPYLTLPHSSFMDCTLFKCIFLGIIGPSPFYLFVSKFFPDVEIFEVFCDMITLTELRTPSGENPRYPVIIYSSWPNIFIHSLEVAKVSDTALLDPLRDTNYTELFVEFLSSNTLLKSDTTDPANHTIVRRC